jgi:hypothetical protein
MLPPLNPTERNMTPDITEDTEKVDDSSEDSATENKTAADDVEEAAEALDELEAEELEMLTEDESSETLVIDEAAEMRAIRRAEISMDVESVDEAAADEFVCSSCFLVKRSSQLANKRKKICRDCAS